MQCSHVVVVCFVFFNVRADPASHVSGFAAVLLREMGALCITLHSDKINLILWLIEVLVTATQLRGAAVVWALLLNIYDGLNQIFTTLYLIVVERRHYKTNEDSSKHARMTSRSLQPPSSLFNFLLPPRAQVALEKRLERLNRELGSLRMTLKRFHILRSSANI